MAVVQRCPGLKALSARRCGRLTRALVLELEAKPGLVFVSGDEVKLPAVVPGM